MRILRVNAWLLGAALLLSPASLRSQQDPEREQLARIVENSSIRQLLRHAPAIGLSDAQVRRLTEVQEQIRRRGQPYVDSLTLLDPAVGSPGGEPGLAGSAGNERRLRMALRNVVREGSAQGWAVLTSRQQADARALLRDESMRRSRRPPEPAVEPGQPNEPAPPPRLLSGNSTTQQSQRDRSR